ncbi:type IV pilus assembly protein PilM [Patescibacteria group bacterium]
MGFFNKKVVDFSEEIFGLDINDLSVKIVQIKKSNNRSSIVAYGNIDIPSGVVSGGEIIKKDILISKIKEVIKNAGPKKIKTNRVICSLPESKSFLRIVSMPKMVDDEMREAIKWEIEANIPLSLDRVYYDWQVLDRKIQQSDEGNVDVLVLASAKTVVGQFIEIVEEAGLEVVNLEVESIAQARSLIREDEEKTSLVIDMGKGSVGLMFAVGNTPCFTSSASISLNSFASFIAKDMGISVEEAEKVKNTYGIGSFAEKDHIFMALEPVLKNLISEIQKSIDFYINGLKYSKSVDRIVVCGGGSNIKGIVTYLSKELKREVELGNPWVNLSSKGELPPIPHEEIIRYATSIGLSIKGADDEYLA